MDYEALLDKLRRIEAIHAGTSSAGERTAAANAMERIKARLAETERRDPPIEYTFSLPDPWTRKLFIALARRYGLSPYRYPRQHRQTILLRVPASFVNETLWPEYEELSEQLHGYLASVTDRVIKEALDGDTSEPEAAPKRIGG